MSPHDKGDGVPIEIEKKYLLERLPFDLSRFEKREITQFYISVDPVIRIRQSDKKYILTVKGPGSMARAEFETPLTEKQFSRLLAKAEGWPVAKTRYIIPIDGGLAAELDVYKDRLAGLLTVEVEFGSVEEAEGFAPPEWFGQDVTFDKRYKNSSLALFGLPGTGL